MEVDESVIAKRKYNRGRRFPARWVFGGIERETRRYSAFMEVVPNRGWRTLYEVCQRYIQPGTTVCSDGWRAYNFFHLMGCSHRVVIHEENFVDPLDRSTHTQNVENNWKNLKMWLRTHGSNLKIVDSIEEFIFRKQHRESVFTAIIQAIAAHSSGEQPPEDPIYEPDSQTDPEDVTDSEDNEG